MIRQAYTILLLTLFFGVVAIAQDGSNLTVRAEQNLIVPDFLDNSNRVDLYPNPAEDFLIVQVSNSNLENAKFQVRSLIGTQMSVSPEDLGDGKYRFPVKDFASGYYFVVVEDELARFKKAFRFLKN